MSGLEKDLVDIAKIRIFWFLKGNDNLKKKKGFVLFYFLMLLGMIIKLYNKL